MKTTNDDPPSAETDPLKSRVRRLGLLACSPAGATVADKPWLAEVCAYEERERQRRSLERRLRFARVGAFKPMADFDWAWPKKIDRGRRRPLHARLLAEGANVVLLGPNGVGKTMLLRNIAHQAVLRGHAVLFTTASDMLADLATQESSAALKRRLAPLLRPQAPLHRRGRLPLLRQPLRRPALRGRHPQVRGTALDRADHQQALRRVADVFPNAACVVTLVDRLIHRAEIVVIDGDSYRLKEATERAAAKAKSRGTKRKP